MQTIRIACPRCQQCARGHFSDRVFHSCRLKEKLQKRRGVHCSRVHQSVGCCVRDCHNHLYWQALANYCVASCEGADLHKKHVLALPAHKDYACTLTFIYIACNVHASTFRTMFPTVAASKKSRRSLGGFIVPGSTKVLGAACKIVIIICIGRLSQTIAWRPVKEPIYTRNTYR